MNAILLYESLFGNTAAVARAIADGLRSIGEVTLSLFEEVPEALAKEADLLVLGGPTHGWGMTKPTSRTSRQAQGYIVGAREWLERSGPTQGAKAAAFDTRFDKPRWLTGSAALRIGRQLGRKGYQLVVPPESFFVQHTDGPLKQGEENRARGWGAELARRVTGS